MSTCSWRIGTRFAQRRTATHLGFVRNAAASAEHRAVVARARGEQQKREQQLPGRNVLTDPVPGKSPRVPLKEHLPSVQEAQLPTALPSALQTTAFPTVVGGLGLCPSRSQPAISWKSVTDPPFASYLVPQGSSLQVGPLG